MSADQYLSTPPDIPTGNPSVPDPAIVSAGGARLRIVAAALALGALTVAAMLVWRPWGERNAFGYDDIAPIRDNLWVGSLVDGIGFAVVAVSLGLGTCLLVRGRGSRFANVGAVLATLGGITFAAGSAAHAAVGWVATSDVISAHTGRALLDFIDDKGGRLMIPAVVGFLLVTLGTLLLATALLRSGALSRWVPIALIVLTVAQFPVPARVQDFVQIAYMALLVCVAALFAGRAKV
jgi:hypothetical protein